MNNACCSELRGEEVRRCIGVRLVRAASGPLHPPRRHSRPRVYDVTLTDEPRRGALMGGEETSE
jgi:hypothetical protein